MSEKYKEINSIIEPIKIMEARYFSMQQEMVAAKKEIDQLKNELKSEPSFAKTKELSILEDSYNRYESMCKELFNQIDTAKKESTPKLKSLANRIVVAEMESELETKNKEAVERVHAAAKMILNTASGLVEHQWALSENVTEQLEEATNIREYFHSSSVEKYPDYSQLSVAAQPKLLVNAFKDMLENIEKNYI